MVKGNDEQANEDVPGRCGPDDAAQDDEQAVVPERKGGGHDLFVRRALEVVENLKSQMRVSMPAQLSGRIGWDSFRLRSSTYVSAELAESRGDVVCDFLLDGLPAHAIALLEHQSYPDSTMPHRVEGYRDDLRDEYAREHPRTEWFPPMFAFVFYTGADGRAWNVPTDLMDMYGFDPETRRICEPYVGPGRYHLVDIAGIDPRELVESALTPEMVITWVLARRARKGDIVERLEMVFDHLVAIDGSPNAELIYRSIIEYAFNNYDAVEGRVESVMARVGAVAKEVQVTTAERIEARGREQGLEQGRLEGERQALLCLLEARFDSVPVDIAAKVDAAGSGQLAVWTRRAAKADRLTEVFDA